MATQYWLMKTEPTTYSIDDLANEKKKTTTWEGVRNYQARNLLRDEIKKGDRVLFYHSACKEPAVVGLATVSKEGYPDSFAFDSSHKYFDVKSKREKPTWYMVDITFKNKFKEPIALSEMKEDKKLEGFRLLARGNRLSVFPVDTKHGKYIEKLGK